MILGSFSTSHIDVNHADFRILSVIIIASKKSNEIVTTPAQSGTNGEWVAVKPHSSESTVVLSM